MIEGSAALEQILGKLTLMIGARQTFGVEGVCWEGLVRVGTFSLGGEAEGVILEVKGVVRKSLIILPR